MSMIHPLLAWGALLGAIPIIIHILSRRRFKVIRWAATDFLLQALAERSRHVRLQDLILLLLRTALLILAAWIVARPVLSSSALERSGLHVRGPDGVIVLDTSYSMATLEAAQQRLDDAKRRAHEVVAAMTSQTRIGVIHMAQQPTVITETLTEDRVAIGTAIDRAEISPTGADLSAAFASAIEMLSGSTAPRKRIYLITDGQSRLFEESSEAVQQMFTEADESVGVVVLTVGNDASSNLAITDLRVGSRWLGVNQPTRIEARIKDLGTNTATQANIELYVDGRKVDRRSVELIDRAGDIVFEHTFTSSGLFSVEVRLDPDSLPTDNHRFAAVYVPEAMPIAVVASEDEPRHNPHTFVNAALDGSKGRSGMVPFEVAARWPVQRVVDGIDREIWAVLLADPGALSIEAGRQLQRFVGRGGALFVTLGQNATSTLGSFRSSNATIDWLGDMMFDIETGGNAVANPDMAASSGVGGDGQMVLDLETPGIREIYESVQVFNAVTLTAAADGAWATPLKMTDGRAMLMTRAIAADSRMAMLTTSLDGRWSDLPYRPAMVPMLQDVMTWLIRPRLVAATLQPWQEWSPKSGEKIVTPDGSTFALSAFQNLDATGEQLGVRFDQTEVVGVYRVTGGDDASGALQAITVNIDPAESASGTWSGDQIQALFPKGRCDLLTNNGTVDAMTLAGLSGSEIWPMLAALLAAMLILEAYLAYRFGAAQGSTSGGQSS